LDALTAFSGPFKDALVSLFFEALFTVTPVAWLSISPSPATSLASDAQAFGPQSSAAVDTESAVAV
jgi:hypothetical protein